MLTTEYLVQYCNDFHSSTRLIPNIIKVSRTQYFDFMRSTYAQNQLLEVGKKYAFHLMSPFGFIPVVAVNDEKYLSNGFVVIDDSEFDQQFEDIVLGKKDA